MSITTEESVNWNPIRQLLDLAMFCLPDKSPQDKWWSGYVVGIFAPLLHNKAPDETKSEENRVERNFRSVYVSIYIT